jgi:Phage integrase, N-terminal SAM-like domain
VNKPLCVPARRELRQRMIEDMNVRGFSAKTQRDYRRIVSHFVTFRGRSPDLAISEDIRRFQIEQREAGMPAPARQPRGRPARTGPKIYGALAAKCSDIGTEYSTVSEQ